MPWVRWARVALAAAAVATGVVASGGVATAAPAQHLPWEFPLAVVGGQPVTVASRLSCPPPPTPGDAVLVQVTLAFVGGASAQVIPAAADRSWSGPVTFQLFGAPPSGSISATCLDFTGFTGVPYASYQAHPVSITNG